jgi:hypothetical protein
MDEDDVAQPAALDAIVHLLTTGQGCDQPRDRQGRLQAIRETEVIVERVEDRPGMLGTVARRLGDAGITTVASRSMCT